MMKRFVFSAFASLVALCGFSQDIYEVASVSATDLNGTARYVGMGGAMNALGGDISTMSSNPAAIGLFRRSDVSATMSLMNQPGAQEFDGKHNRYVSFDQLGFVYCQPVGSGSLKFINFGANYHKSRDFNQLVQAANANLGAHDFVSQTWQLADLANYWGTPSEATPLTDMAYEGYLLDDAENDYAGYGASAHALGRATWGGNHGLDLNLSANINDQVYLGATVTGYFLNKKSSMGYGENLVAWDAATDSYYDDGAYILTGSNKLDGTGYDFKLGIVVRPIKTSNFKVGLSLTTPTYYDLTYTNESRLYCSTSWGEGLVRQPYAIDYDYKVRTPWKMNLSVANTFFNRLALGAEYELADYSSCSVSYGDEYDDWSAKDRALNRECDKYLKPTHTLKVGAELMIIPQLYLRCGYNFQSSPFEDNAFRNQFINSASIDAATSTDYMNLSNLNRYTVGLGLKLGSFYADAAWLYQRQHGDFYAFDGWDSDLSEDMCPKSRVGLSKSQFALTLGYRF